VTESAPPIQPIAVAPQLSGVSLRRITLATGVNVAGRILGVVLGIAVAAILARSLGVAGFGRLSLALTFVGLAGTVGDFGLSQVAVREMAARPERRAQVLGSLVAFRVLMGSVATVVVLGLVALMLPPGSARLMGILVAASIPLGAVSALQSGAQARLRPELMTIVVLGQSAVWLALVVLLASRHASQAWYGGAFLIAAAAQAVLAWAVIRRVTSIAWPPTRAEVRRLLSSALPLGLAGLFVTTYYRIDGIILYQLKGAEQTAIYAAAYRFLDVLQVFPAAVLAVLLPLLSTFRRTDDLRGPKAVETALAVLGFVALPVVAGGTLTSGRVVEVLYGSSFRGSATVLAILLPAFLSICLGYVFTAVLIAEGRVWPCALVAAAAALGNVIANVLLIPHFGARAAAAVTVATEFPSMAAIALLASRMTAIALPWSRWGRMVLAVLPMAAVMVASKSQSLPLILLAGGGAYLACAVALGAVQRNDIRLLMGRSEEVFS
jgi:O-antigen/teichoic acid export membrane protein